jgi:hypothetical protein
MAVVEIGKIVTPKEDNLFLYIIIYGVTSGGFRGGRAGRVPP